ncbi:hypothetical protein AAE478_005897 [Parahypoxylon ruwenzoriense]
MPQRGIKRRATLGSTLDEPDNQKKRDVKKSKLNSNKRLSRLEEYKEDEGRDGSRAFQQWAEIFAKNTEGEATKSKAFLRSFETKVKKQTERVRDYAREREEELARTKDQFVATFEELCPETADYRGTSGEPENIARGTSKENHALFKDAQAIISGSYSLLTQFKEVDERLKTYKLESPTERWKKDRQDMRELLACGRDYGEKLVEDKLAPNTHPSPLPDRYKASERGNMTSRLFKDSHRASDKDSWGTVAADQAKRLTAVAKTIPTKDTERSRY